MRRTQIFKDSWAHGGKCTGYVTMPGSVSRHTPDDVPKLHADFWAMVAAEMGDTETRVFLKVV